MLQALQLSLHKCKILKIKNISVVFSTLETKEGFCLKAYYTGNIYWSNLKQ